MTTINTNLLVFWIMVTAILAIVVVIQWAVRSQITRSLARRNKLVHELREELDEVRRPRHSPLKLATPMSFKTVRHHGPMPPKSEERQ